MVPLFLCTIYKCYVLYDIYFIIDQSILPISSALDINFK